MDRTVSQRLCRDEDQSEPDQAPARHGATAVSATGPRDPCVLRCFRLDGRDTRDRAKNGGRVMASAVQKPKMKEVPLSEVKDDLPAFFGRPRHRTSSSHATASRRACSSGSSRRTTGSTTGLNTTRGSCSASSRLAPASVRAGASSSKTSNNGALQEPAAHHDGEVTR